MRDIIMNNRGQSCNTTYTTPAMPALVTACATIVVVVIVVARGIVLTMMVIQVLSASHIA